MGEEHSAVIPYIREIVIFLAATVAVALAARRLNVTPILGYLAVGVFIGPYGLGLMRDVEGVRRIAELGVVFLLFVIGLELSLERLKALRRFIFGLGGAQVLATGAIIGAISHYAGVSAEAALVIGVSLALSSTAMVMQLLTERGEMSTRTGRVSVAILLFQDLAVVPLIVLVNLFAEADTNILTQIGIAIGKAALAVAAIYLAGRLVMHRLFRVVARTRESEIFIAMTLIGILGTAWLTAQAGLSMALGAFLAGLLLADTEFRHQVESDIQPFKGLMLALFFTGVGMGVDVSAVADSAQWLLVAVIALVFVKALLLFGLTRLFGLSPGTSAHIALMLAGGGEFAFVVIGVALASGVLTAPVAQFILMVAGLSMMLTPLLATLGARLKARLDHEARGLSFLPEACAADDLEGHVIIAGFGRVGQMVMRLLRTQKVAFRALDLNVARVKHFHAQGEPVYYGDASRSEILAALGAPKAAAAVITLDNHEAASLAVETLRQHWPSLAIFVRARDGAHSRSLREAGADGVVPETVETSLQLSAQVLSSLGVPRDSVNKLVTRIRAENYELVLDPPSIVPVASPATENTPQNSTLS